MVNFCLIAAIDIHTNGIGINGKLPWNIKKDLKYFSELTNECDVNKQNIVVMGRKTWESIPNKPLKNRINIVLSSNDIDLNEYENTYHFTSLEEVVEKYGNSDSIDNIFIIGGSRVYEKALELKLDDFVYLTEIKVHNDTVIEYDCFFPKLDKTNYEKILPNPYYYDNYMNLREKRIKSLFFHDGGDCAGNYQFVTYIKKNTEEQQYLDLIKEILENGVRKSNRTGIDTLSLFGRTMRFSLRNGKFPLLTTKKVFWKGVAEELLWFISGSTNSNILANKGVNIWKGNTSREFLDNLGLTNYEKGDCGPVYGFQWRHFGAEYTDMHGNYEGKGIDQLKQIIETIKTDPNSRRLVMTAWDPVSIGQMVLPPCHSMCQFYVENGELSCQLYQRSCDIGLGVPFNIASYSLLTVLIAHCTGLKPGDFIHVLGDTHVYVNHIDALKQQIERNPRIFPTLKITTDNTNIDNFTMNDFQLSGYNPYPNIKMDMAV